MNTTRTADIHHSAVAVLVVLTVIATAPGAAAQHVWTESAFDDLVFLQHRNAAVARALGSTPSSPIR